VKRLFDTIVAAMLLLLVSPVMLATACAIRIGMGSPVLLRQTRPGLYGRPFTFYKFRTMTDWRDADGNLLPDAERITPLGRWLRRTSLDELPQLFNVLKGDMSLIGPRPLLMEYLSLYSAGQMRRHEVRPGITGWAQVNGRNAVDWPERFRMDVWYVDNRSFWLDMKILGLTLLKVFQGSGISQPGQATMTRFTGNADRMKDD
jgi:sugar transferase EpsL